MKRCAWLMFLLVLPAAVSAQPRSEVGRPFITTYGPKQHGGHTQTWAFAQDTRGVMYIGSSPGVLEYDGAFWRMIPVTNKSFARSLSIANDGRIYVGASSDFGYLVPDAHGQLHYVSLAGQVPAEHHFSGYVWTTHATPEGVYFQARDRIFRLTPVRNAELPGADGQHNASWEIKVWQPQGRFYFAFWIQGTYYVHQYGVGLMKMQDDSLHLLAGSEQFANERLQVMLPFGEGRILIGTFNRGLFLYEDGSFRPFRTEADVFLQQSTLYEGALLQTDPCWVGLATLDGGFLILDENGKSVQHLDQSAGLPSNAINAVFRDRQGTIWLAAENGIVLVETPSPLSRFDASAGFPGGAYDLQRHKGLLYVATTYGILYLDPKTRRFRQVTGLAAGNPQSFALLSVGETLLAAVSTGIHHITGTTAMPVRILPGSTYQPIFFHRSLQDSDRVFVALFDGLASLRRQGGQWLDEGRIHGIHDYIIRIAEQEPGVLWLGTIDQGVMRVTLSGMTLHPAKIEHFKHGQGLPSEGGIAVFAVAGRLVFAMPGAVYRFEAESRQFVPDSLFMKVVGFGIAQEEYCIVEDREQNLWLCLGEESAVLRRQPDGSYRTEKAPLLRFADERAIDIHIDDEGVVWFASIEAVIRYDPRVPKNYDAAFPTLIRRVIASDGAIVHGGAASTHGATLPPPALPHAQNALRFEFATTSFDHPSENRFQSMLEGFDTHWSEWSRDHRRDYTNLPEGEYRFRVRARNIYQHPGEEAAFAFSILPPWYRTWYAYGLYVTLLGLVVFAADRIQRRRVVGRERARAQLREIELRAQAAEALARSESERKKYVELLSEIGKELTASLDFDTIFYRLYEHVNQLVDAAVFGVGLYRPEQQLIEYRLALENGKRYVPYTRDTHDPDQLPVWCITHRQPVFINDVATEYSRYIRVFKDMRRLLEDGTYSEAPQSLIYLPLVTQDRVLGVISVQSFRKHAYTEYHLNVLQNLATYTTIALDNADAYRRLNVTLEHLQATQEQLVVQEKLASLGQLTAGIAHEIKNPLNFVNNFAVITMELAEELRVLLASAGDRTFNEEERANLEQVLHDLVQNARKINEHGKRADGIVRSMLQLSRGTTGEREIVDLNVVIDEAANLTYHGMRAQEPSFNITIVKEYDAALGRVAVVQQDVSRVFLNIISNACYAAHQKKLALGESFAPTLTLHTCGREDMVEIRIRDNGNGIPEEIREQIFNPFFTTKPSGKGTGLGLSISYDIIVREHQGEIRVETQEGQYTEFIITLPRS